METPDPRAPDPSEEVLRRERVRLLEEARPRPLHPAPIMARAAAFVIDGAFVLLGMMALVGVDALVLKGNTPGLVVSVLGSAVLACFLLLPELRWGTTPGKSFLRLGVAAADGTRPGKGALAVRFLVRYPIALALTTEKDPNVVDMVFFALQALAIAGGFLCYFFARGRTLSDLLTRTRVVYRLPGGGPRVP